MLLYRNVSYFCVLILYPATLLNPLFSSSNFLIISLGFSMYSIMSSARSESFISFLIWVPFVYFSSLISMARTSKTMLNNSGKSGHPCLVPDLRGHAFSFSPLRIIFAVGLSYISFMYVDVHSFSALFLKSFYNKWVLNFVESFFWIYWNDHMVFIFQFVNMGYNTDWFVYVEESWHPWEKPNLIMVSHLFNVLLDSVC